MTFGSSIFRKFLINKRKWSIPIVTIRSETLDFSLHSLRGGNCTRQVDSNIGKINVARLSFAEALRSSFAISFPVDPPSEDSARWARLYLLCNYFLTRSRFSRANTPRRLFSPRMIIPCSSVEQSRGSPSPWEREFGPAARRLWYPVCPPTRYFRHRWQLTRPLGPPVLRLSFTSV